MTSPKKTTKQLAAKPAAKKVVSEPQPEVAVAFGVKKPTAHRPLNLIEVQDSADLDVIVQNPKIKPHVLARLSPTAALLTIGSEKTVLEVLLKAGHTPRVVSNNTLNKVDL